MLQAGLFLEQAYPARRYTLDTPSWAVRNQHFYAKLGYVRVGETSYPDITLFAYERGPVMRASDLVHTTGDVVIDDTCAGLIRLGDLLLPARLHSWYLQGSHAEQAATGLSDLDLIAVVRGSVTASERHVFAELVAACKHLAPDALDVTLLSEADLAALAEPGVWKQAELVLYATTLRLSSRLLAGDDLRPALPAIPADDLVRARMRFPMAVLAGQRGHPALLRFPLDAPLPDDRFLGYTARSLRDRERQRHPSTKRLMHGTGFIATALLAQAGHTDVGSRREAVRRYRAVFDDRWADLYRYNLELAIRLG